MNGRLANVTLGSDKLAAVTRIQRALMKHTTKLSPDLQPIYDFELARGNELSHVEEPAGTNCPYAVVLKRPLDKRRILAELHLPPTVRFWESRDPHYSIEAGFFCDVTHHSIAGPIG